MSGQSDRIPRTQAGRLAHAELHRFMDTTATPCPGPTCPHARIIDRVERETAASPEPPLMDCPECGHEVVKPMGAFHAPTCSVFGTEAAPPEPPLDVERLADFIREKIESEPYQGLHPELASMGLAVALRDEWRAAPPEPPLDVERLAQALYDGHVQHVLHSYSYTNRQIAQEIAAAYGGAAPERLPSVEARLLDLAMSVRRMVEDGHPDSPEWFRIMCERVHAVDDITDAALMEGEDAALASLHEEPSSPQETDG